MAVVLGGGTSVGGAPGECVVRFARLKSMVYERASLLYYSQHVSMRVDARILEMMRELEELEKRLDDEFDCSRDSYTRFYGLINTYYVNTLEILAKLLRKP